MGDVSWNLWEIFYFGILDCLLCNTYKSDSAILTVSKSNWFSVLTCLTIPILQNVEDSYHSFLKFCFWSEISGVNIQTCSMITRVNYHVEKHYVIIVLTCFEDKRKYVWYIIWQYANCFYPVVYFSRLYIKFYNFKHIALIFSIETHSTRTGKGHKTKFCITSTKCILFVIICTL